MKLAGRIPVEPLDEERLTNIERRVVAGAVDAANHHGTLRGTLGALHAPRRQVRRALAVAALAAAGLAGWALRTAPGPGPEITEPAAIQVHTDREGSRLAVGDASIKSEPGTVFAISRPEGGVLVTMTRGMVEIEVGKRGARSPLIVRAGDTDVVVVGTHFTVDYGDGSGEVDVRVREGTVRVVHRQHETRVAAGQAWRTGTGLVASTEATEAMQAMQATQAMQDPARAHLASPTASGGPAASPGATPGREPLISRAPGPEVLRDRTPAAPEVLREREAVVPGAPETQPARPVRPRPVRPARVDRLRSPGTGPGARSGAGSTDPVLDLKAAVRVQPVEPALDLGERDPARAIATYSSIAAHRSGAEASRAFYSIAVVDHLALGRDSDALHWLDAYVRRFPGGKEYRAALWLRVRILCLARIDDRCRAAAHRYLREAPDGATGRVAERLTHTR